MRMVKIAFDFGGTDPSHTTQRFFSYGDCNMTDPTTIHGEGIHVGDCYVWAEISYLDSPTDYREHLPKHASRESRATDEEFVTLDSEVKTHGVLSAIRRLISQCLSRKE
jgi:hypothetical protein